MLIRNTAAAAQRAVTEWQFTLSWMQAQAALVQAISKRPPLLRVKFSNTSNKVHVSKQTIVSRQVVQSQLHICMPVYTGSEVPCCDI